MYAYNVSLIKLNMNVLLLLIGMVGGKIDGVTTRKRTKINKNEIIYNICYKMIAFTTFYYICYVLHLKNIFDNICFIIFLLRLIRFHSDFSFT